MSVNTENTTTEVITSPYTALATTDMSSIMGEDMAGLDFSFDRVKIPSGGSTAFEMADPDGAEGDMTMVKELKGVILFNHPAYAYYREKYTGGNNPPDCGSLNGVTGIGMPGGNCRTCPYNKFGSGEGQSKACKNRRMLYILQEGELFPVTLSLPTGSIKPFTDFVKRQLTRGRSLSQIVTKISLKKASNSNGISYSQAVFTFERALTAEERDALAPMVEQIKDYAFSRTLDSLSDDVPFVDTETGEVIEPLR